MAGSNRPREADMLGPSHKIVTVAIPGEGRRFPRSAMAPKIERQHVTSRKRFDHLIPAPGVEARGMDQDDGGLGARRAPFKPMKGHPVQYGGVFGGPLGHGQLPAKKTQSTR